VIPSRAARVLHGDVDAVGFTGVVFSPDGERVASQPKRGMVKVWNTRTWREILSLKEVSSPLAFSPDSHWLASVWRGDNVNPEKVKVWNVATGQEVFAFAITPAPFNPIHDVAFSPDGKYLAVAAGGQPRDAIGIVKLWDLTTGKEAVTIKPWHRFTHIAFSPDGKVLVSNSSTHAWGPGGLAFSLLQFWNTGTGKEMFLIKGDTTDTEVCDMVFRPDGRQLACACMDGTVRVWDMAMGKAIHAIKAHTMALSTDTSSVAYSSDGKRLASAGPDGVKIWDPVTGQEICTLKVRRTTFVQPYRVAFSPDGKYLASVDGEGVNLWEAGIGTKGSNH
jgi:WD40 repeat protein